MKCKHKETYQASWNKEDLMVFRHTRTICMRCGKVLNEDMEYLYPPKWMLSLKTELDVRQRAIDLEEMLEYYKHRIYIAFGVLPKCVILPAAV